LETADAQPLASREIYNLQKITFAQICCTIRNARLTKVFINLTISVVFGGTLQRRSSLQFK